MILIIIIGILLNVIFDPLDTKIFNEPITCIELNEPIGTADCIRLSEAYVCCRNSLGMFESAKICDNRYIPLIIARCIEK